MFGRRGKPRGLDRYLAPQEDVILLCRRHPVVLARPILLWLVALVIGAAAGFLTSPRSGETIIDQIAGWFVLAATVGTVLKVWQWWASTYVVTDQRVMLIEGILARKISAIPLPKVTDTTYRRSAAGRIFGFGSLLLDSPGETPGLATLTYLPRPDRIYRLITSLVVSRVWDKSVTREQQFVPEEEDTGPIPRVIA